MGIEFPQQSFQPSLERDFGERAVNYKIRRLGLIEPGGGSARNPKLPRYPARADLTEYSEAVPEQERPWVFGG